MLFGWSGKFYFPEIEIRWPKKNAFDHGNRFTLLFSLQSISEKWERERESACARARGEATNAISPSQDRAIGHDLAVARSRRWSRSRLREIAPARDQRGRSVEEDREIREEDPSIAISRRREIREEEFELCLSFFWVVACIFLDLCFPSSFPNTRKYFPENFLKCNQTHGNIFLFRKLAFPKNMYFPENVLQQPNTA